MDMLKQLKLVPVEAIIMNQNFIKTLEFLVSTFCIVTKRKAAVR